MRQIGTLSNEEHARRFEDYVLTRGMTAKVDEENGQWTVWIYDEDHVEQAKQELERFTDDPNAPLFREAAQQARQIRRQTEQEAERARKQVVEVRPQWDRPAGRRSPLTFILIAMSVVVTIATDFGRDPESILGDILISAPRGAGGLQKITEEFEIWRLVTPIFLHLTWLHLIFNSLWAYTLGIPIELLRGTGRMLALVLVIAIVSNLAQYYTDGPYFGGLSGVVYGLFGYSWVKSRYQPELGIYVDANTAVWLMGWFVLCYLGLVGDIANTAHAAGLGAGVALAYAPIAWRNLMRKP